MDVAVFGAGIAGLMSAIALRAQGVACRVYERSHQAHDAGMGFILVPDGIARLQHFGVHLRGTASGRLLTRYSCRDSSGKVILEHTLPQGTLGVRRRDLTTALMQALGGDESIVFGLELEDVEYDKDQRVRAAVMSSVAGKREVRADVFVGAEGVNSRIRQVLFPDWPTSTDPVPEIVGLVHCREAIDWAGHTLNKFHASDGGVALGILPVSDEHIVWYLQFDAQRFPMSRRMMDASDPQCAIARCAFVQKLVGTWAHPVPKLLEATDFHQVHLWRPVDTDLIPQFHRRNLVLVGDAAHPLSPFTSQGVSLGIADAVALARGLGSVKSCADLEPALDRYSRERHLECVPYVAKGRELTARFLGPLSVETAVLPIALQAPAWGQAHG